jgi:MSHA biogenesis protein MshQ
MIARLIVAIVALLAAAGACAEPLPAALVGEYRFDLPSPVIVDSSGTGHGGTYAPAGSAGWSIDAPARPGSPGTCGYATMNQSGAGVIDNLPVLLGEGQRNSVAFWMYWDGTDNVMPIGWEIHDLWLYNGYFGFNTGAGDIYGISSTGLASGWHHVVAVFNNGDYTYSKLYIDGVLQTLEQKLSSQYPPGAVVQPTMYIGSWGGGGYLFSGRLDEVRVYTGELTQGEVTTIYNAVRPCPDSNPPPVPALSPATLAGLAALLGRAAIFGLRRRGA